MRGWGRGGGSLRLCHILGPPCRRQVGNPVSKRMHLQLKKKKRKRQKREVKLQGDPADSVGQDVDIVAI